jgi:6-phosphofructokinase 1
MKLGILTSGGDAPGMNAVIHGASQVVRAAGGTLAGFKHGLQGIVDADVCAVDVLAAEAESSTAGTMLGTSRSQALLDGAGFERALAAASVDAPDGLIIVGGNGSLNAAHQLATRMTVAFVPATIDNDVPGSEQAIGFDSAVAYAVDAVERLRVTAAALPGRAFIVETLGGDNGNLARAVAAAARIELVVTPEEPIDPPKIAAGLDLAARSDAAIVILCEGATNAVALAQSIEPFSRLRVRPTILGHAQRAATPTEFDRTLGFLAGAAAASELAAGRSSFVGLHTDGTVHAERLGNLAHR